MNYIALKQDYEELIALEHLLLDCQRRLILANEKKFINFKKNSNIHIVGTGFSAVLAFHALRSSSKILSVYDPFKKNDFYELPGTVNKSLEKFPTDSEGLVLLACAPGIAKELMVRVQNIAQGCELILLFADDDSENTIKYDMRSGWIRLNMSYRCINKAANMARCYRPVTIASPAPVYVMGSGLAGLIAQLGLGMAGIKFAGYVNQSKVTRETDLLVTYADETFSGKERSLCDGICCRSAQFLFRAGDSVIPGLAVDGFSECRLLGSGEEGDVFDAVGPDGSRYCYKRFYNARDRTEELNWVRSFADGPPCLAWMGDACGVPDERAERGICYPYIKLMHIPFMDEGRDRTLRATVSYCLQFQAAHISRARVPATMPGGIHVMCDESGKLRYVDIGNYPPALSECGPELLKGFVIKGLAGLTHETIFPGKLWKDLQSEKKLLTLAERLYSEQIKVPHWYRDMINEALSLPAESFKDEATYHRLAQKYAPNPPVLPNDVSAQAHGLTSLPSAYPIKESAAEPWFQERLYQNFRYKRGKIEGAGPTGHKYSLIAEEFERIVSGSSYLDIGSNMGFFVAKAALLTDKPCIGIEKKGTFRLQAEHVFKVVGTKNARVIRARFNPNFPLTDSDVVSAFAVIHHLYLMDGAFISLASMVDYLAMAARKALFIEFIHNPGYKEKAEIMHGRSFNDYTETRLVNALKQRFSSVRKLAEVSPSRVVYLGTN